MEFGWIYVGTQVDFTPIIEGYVIKELLAAFVKWNGELLTTYSVGLCANVNCTDLTITAKKEASAKHAGKPAVAISIPSAP